VDHPLHAPSASTDALVRPWRTAAYVAVAIAAFELVLLLAIGGGKLVGFVADRIEGAAQQQMLAPDSQTRAPQVTRKPAVATAVIKRPRSKTVVMVLNGNGRTGAAASAASRVQSHGYRIGTVTNAPRQVSRSIVMYRPGFAGEGRRLGKDIGVDRVIPLDGMRASALGGAHVVFILGP
jgi:LytR cell envelope-related transcriptional attenuator